MSQPHIILDHTDIERILRRIVHEILETHKGVHNLALIGIHTRGALMARRIQKLIQNLEGATLPTGVMDINLYRDDWTQISQAPVVQATEIGFGVNQMQIVLVDDVLFTGRTIRAAMDAVMDFGRPDRIELAVLVDRGHRELPIQANYVGKHIETRRSETINVLLQESDGVDQVVISRNNEE